MAGGGWVGECRFEVHAGYVPEEAFSAHDIARAAGEGKIFFPERPAKWVTAYGPQAE